MLDKFINKHQLSSEFKESATAYYIPLAERIKAHQDSAKPFFVGINGCQGSGKSTLANFLRAYLSSTHNLDVVVISIDDFYYDKVRRTDLAQQIHPLLSTRGVPGTHNTELAAHIFNQLHNNQTNIRIPRFDKAADNPSPEDQWQHLTRVPDIVIIEGWCWGVKSQAESLLIKPVNTLEQERDPDCVWRQYVNQQLRSNYEPLYDHTDLWVMLKAPSFYRVYQWRLEQEEKLRAVTPSSAKNHVMSPAQIKDFIQYYQRLTEHALLSLPDYCDHVYELDARRNIINYVRQ